MYESYFGFDQEPFNVTPDSDFIYYSEQHKEALAHMLYGVQERKGFILVTGRVGSGKTTLCRAFMKELNENTSIALVLNSKMTAQEILEAIADDFGLELRENPTTKDIIDRLNEFVLEEYRNGRNVCVIIDESQNLSPDALENLRLLSNLETEKEKLLQIVLVGQPELNTLLNKNELRQLKQRITVRAYLSNLTAEETRRYVTHRLEQARPRKPIEIPDKVFERLHEMSAGNPRAINLIMDHTLLAAYVDETFTLKTDHIDRAVEELSQHVEQQEGKDARVLHRVRTRAEEFSFPGWLEPSMRRLDQPWIYGSLSAIVTLSVLIGGTWYFNGGNGASEPPIISRNFIEQPLASDTRLARSESGIDTNSTPDTTPVSPYADTDPEMSQTEAEPDESSQRQPTVAQDTRPIAEEVTESNPVEDTPEVKQVQETQQDTEDESPSAPDTTARSEQPTVIATALGRQEGKSIEPMPNPLSIDPVNESQLSGSEILSLARYISLKIKQKDNLPASFPNPLLSELNRSLTIDEIIPESLPGQLLSVESQDGLPRTYGFPALLEWNPSGAPPRTVLFLPYQAQVWDPFKGWIKLDAGMIKREWTGRGHYLVRPPFDPNKLSDRGDVSSEVTELQRLLNEAGDYGIPLVGRYGPMTEASVRDFQKKQGLRADGIAGSRTNRVLLREAIYSNRWSPEEYARFIRKVEADVVLD